MTDSATTLTYKALQDQYLEALTDDGVEVVDYLQVSEGYWEPRVKLEFLDVSVEEMTNYLTERNL